MERFAWVEFADMHLAYGAAYGKCKGNRLGFITSVFLTECVHIIELLFLGRKDIWRGILPVLDPPPLQVTPMLGKIME